MKVLVVSDTHGRDESLEMAVALEQPFDYLIHCGDVEGREFFIEALAECPCTIVAGNNDFMFSDLELRRTGTTYTADTLQILTREHPECEWYFILGADSFFQLEQWYHPERIFANAIILAAGRDDVPAEQMRKHKEYLCQKYHARIQLIDMQQIEISSHEIREMIARGHSVDEMLPQAVAAYIHEQRLYLDPVQGRKGN